MNIFDTAFGDILAIVLVFIYLFFIAAFFALLEVLLLVFSFIVLVPWAINWLAG